MKKKQKGLRRVCAWALAAAMILGGGITFPDASLTAEAEESGRSSSSVEHCHSSGETARQAMAWVSLEFMTVSDCWFCFRFYAHKHIHPAAPAA